MEYDIVLHDYSSSAYLQYAMTTVLDRALVTVADGNKPVHRRILYAMERLGLRPDAKPVKSARVVGEVLGKFHPHGDSSVYDAMVRMAQDFSLRYPLVHGQGNFGSRDGDSAAAMRYTEVKLSPIAYLLLDDLGQDSVDFKSNYDNSLTEPTLLPARLPFALLNGTQGIAVGMASNIPSHNLREVAAAAALLVGNPAASDDEVLDNIQGPDFPDGGRVSITRAALLDVYRSGRGSIRMQATWVVEPLARGQWQIAITELPYQVSAKLVAQEIATLADPLPPSGKKQITPQQSAMRQGALNLIEGIRDESGREHRIRLVITPKHSKLDPEVLMSFLTQNTSLSCNFSVNMTTLGLDGSPTTRGLVPVLRDWCEFRLITARRKIVHRLGQVQARLHVLEGRLVVYMNVLEVIKLIHEADDPRVELMTRYSMSEIQADDILDMRLRQINKLDGFKIQKDLDELRKEAASLQNLLDKEPLLRKLVVSEIVKDSEKFGDDRRTRIEVPSGNESAPSPSALVDLPLTVLLNQNHYLRAKQGHEDASKPLSDKDKLRLWGRTAWPVGVLDSTGRVYSIKTSDIPMGQGNGVPVSALISLGQGASLAGLVTGDPDQRVLIVKESGLGFVARVKDCQSRQKAGSAFVSLDAGDRILHVQALDPGADRLALVSSAKRALVIDLAEVKELNGGGKGVKLIGLDTGAQVTAVQVFSSTQAVESAIPDYPELDLADPRYMGTRASKGAKPALKRKPKPAADSAPQD